MEMKKEKKYFTIFEHEKEQEYLRKKHKEGWKFVKVTGMGTYHFEKCEPEDVVYQLDYNQDGIAHKEEYVQMFEDCGWEYMMDFWGYSYFRKPSSQMHGEEEIFCDESSRLEMMERVYKGRLLPLVVVFSALLIPQFIMNVAFYQNYLRATFLGTIIVMYLIIFAIFVGNYNKYKKNSGK